MRNTLALVKPARAPDVKFAEVVLGDRAGAMGFLGLALPAVAMPAHSGAVAGALPDTGAHASAPMVVAAIQSDGAEAEGRAVFSEQPVEEAPVSPEVADYFGA